MLLAIDIGNSTIAVGLFEDERLVCHFRLPSDTARTDEAYRTAMRSAFELEKVETGHIRAAMVSTVVPALRPVFLAVIEGSLDLKPVFVTHTMDTGLTLSYRSPAELGTDRLLNAMAAYHRHRTDLIVVDLGTATTFSVVSRSGEFKGGAIAPGLHTAGAALSAATAQLPMADLLVPEAVVATDTITALRSGIVFGHAAMVDGMIQRMQRELGVSSMIIATGGFAQLIAPISRTIQEVSPTLTLEGLALLHARQRTHPRPASS